jgi:hypothetical protein
VSYFTKANAQEHASNGHEVRHAASRKTAYSNAVNLQQLVLSDAQAAEVKPGLRARLVDAFIQLEELKRKLKMRPLPKPIDVSHKKAKSRPTGPAFTEE